MSLYMEKGAEIELFAIAACKGYNVLTHDLENTYIYHTTFGRGGFWVYDLYKLFYLAVKANLLTAEKATQALITLDNSDKVIPNGFEDFVRRLDEFAHKHIDPRDTEKFPK